MQQSFTHLNVSSAYSLRYGTALPEKIVAKADADKTREVTGYAIGGVPPLGHATKMKILIDETFKKFDEIWAAAGHPHFVFPTTYEELVRLSGAIPTDVALKGSN